jgi:hypothetical protein
MRRHVSRWPTTVTVAPGIFASLASRATAAGARELCSDIRDGREGRREVGQGTREVRQPGRDLHRDGDVRRTGEDRPGAPASRATGLCRPCKRMGLGQRLIVTWSLWTAPAGGRGGMGRKAVAQRVGRPKSRRLLG